jgi:hypothetical protein
MNGVRRAVFYAVATSAVGLVAVSGCGRGTDVTSRSIRDARRVWTKANIRDYDLEWTASGPLSGHYLVYVRGGLVREVRRILSDPRQIQANHGNEIVVARPADPSLYGVDGLFKILEQEFDAAQSDQPFGQPKGARVLLKFSPDATLGYPRRYRRDVSGSLLALAIDVLGFDRNSAAIPPVPSD